MGFLISELVWLRSSLVVLGIFSPLMRLFSDSQAALNIAGNPVSNERTKHIEIDYHFVKESLKQEFSHTLMLGLSNNQQISLQSAQKGTFLVLRRASWHY